MKSIKSLFAKNTVLLSIVNVIYKLKRQLKTMKHVFIICRCFVRSLLLVYMSVTIHVEVHHVQHVMCSAQSQRINDVSDSQPRLNLSAPTRRKFLTTSRKREQRRKWQSESKRRQKWYDIVFHIYIEIHYECLQIFHY